MSNSLVPLKPVKVIDPVCKVQNVRDYAVLESGNKITMKAYAPTTIGTASIDWNANPPSSANIIDRQISATIPVRITFTGQIIASNGAFVPNATLINAGKDSLRAYPIGGALETLSLKINGGNISQRVSDIIHPMSHYNTDNAMRGEFYSSFPNYLDQSQNYSDLSGTNRNPLGNYANGSMGEPVPRGGHPFTIVSNTVVAATTGAGTTATAIVDAVITEPIWLSPIHFSSQKDDVQGFYNVNSLSLTMNFIANAAYRMWSHSDAAIATSGANTVRSVITSASVQFSNFTGTPFSYNAQPQLLFKYITPNVLQPLSQNVPYTYPYYEPKYWPLDIGTLSYAAGAQTFQSNSIQLNQIPRAVIIFGRPTNQALQSDMTLTDTYLSIENVAIDFCNQSTVMSTASKQQLFQINNLNGGTDSWNAWSGDGVFNSALNNTTGFTKFCGGCGPLRLDFGNQIQLDANQASGLSQGGPFQIQVSATMANKNSGGQWDNVPMTLGLIFIYEGTFTITPGSSQTNLSVLTSMDVLDAQTQVGVNYRKLQSVAGGDFWSGLESFGKSVNSFLKDSKVISNVASLLPHPIAQGIATGARNLGYGRRQICR